MASIFKRDGRRGYTLQWVEDGRLRQKQFKTKTAAETEKDTVRARLRRAAGLESDTTLRAYAETWLKRAAANTRPRTFEQYTWAMHQHILPTLGELHLRRITRTPVRVKPNETRLIGNY